MKKFCLLLSPLLLLPTVEAANWPQWRGPQGTGVSSEKGLPAEWNGKSNIVWKTQLGGLGVSSPVIWDDRVFLTYQVGAGALRAGRHPTFVQGSDPAAAGEFPLGGTRVEGTGETKVAFGVAAFRVADGKVLWEHKLDAVGELPAVHEKCNLATPSPATDGERIYAWFGNGQLVALDFDGKLVWARHLGREYGPFEISWGHSSSPVVYRDRLILVCYHEASSFLLALDKRTGKQLWRVDREKGLKSYSTPLAVETSTGPEIIVNASEGVEAFDPETGKQLWQFKEANRFPIPMPVYADGMLYLSRGYRSGPYMAFRAGGRGNISKADLLWHTETGAPYVSSLIHQDGLIYMATELGIVTCIDAKTGERVWRERLGGLFSASPVAGDGKIYFLSETGETIVLRAGRKPEVLARNKLDEQCIASPAIANGKLFIRTARHLIAVSDPSR
jgi:outer membrane protein assembly factor BamB